MPKLLLIYASLLYAASVLGLAPKGPWDSFNLAPRTRIVRPTGVHSQQGNVKNSNLLLQDGKNAAVFGSTGSWVALDFGKEVSRD